MTNIKWAPIVGILLLVIGVCGTAIPGIIPTESALTFIGLGLTTLGINHSNVQLGRAMGRANY